MQKIKSILSNNHDPSFNLAAEEFLLRETTEDIFFFYINSPSVIIGKHQNALAEINLSYLEENNIPLYRRLSGGGTVYHDLGNINFCFIKTGETHDLVNFKKATQPIVDTLNSWNISARTGERNDLLINFKKISGNACHVFKKRVMHHGTLLYKSDLEKLTFSLKSDPTKFIDKAVKSVRSEVMNISEVLTDDLSAQSFMEKLENSIRNNKPGAELYSFTTDELEAISKLRDEKYITEEWNYSYGPAYEFKKRSTVNGISYLVAMKIEKGKITTVKIKSSNSDEECTNKLIEVIRDKYHKKRELLTNIEMSGVCNLLGCKPAEIVSIFF